MERILIRKGFLDFIKRMLFWRKHYPDPIVRHQALRPILPQVIQIVQKLQAKGFKAYIVGGSVRDLLVGCVPKDFDIVTDARPNQVRKLFKHSMIIGRRFRLVHVKYGRGANDFIEVATFRANAKIRGWSNNRKANNNIYGDQFTDAWRRDFTLNALLYDPIQNCIIDHCGGLSAIQKKQIVMIGEPRLRFQEDPVRMLRAVRFAAKLEFSLAENITSAMMQQRALLRQASVDRMYLEVLKLFYTGCGVTVWHLLRQYELLDVIFPAITQVLQHQQFGKRTANFVVEALTQADQRFMQDKHLSPAFLFSVLYWFPWLLMRKTVKTRRRTVLRHKMLAMLQESRKHVAVSNRVCDAVVAIWDLQMTFQRRKPKQIERLMTHPRFRAAYDFLLIRAKLGEVSQDLVDWWSNYLAADADTQAGMLVALEKNT